MWPKGQRSTHLFPGLPNELGHWLLVVFLHGEIGGDGRVVAAQEAYSSSVICPSCSLFCVIVPNRDTAFSQGSHLFIA